MPIERRYPRGTEFPTEAFVQAAIEEYFRHLGFAIDSAGHVDLLCSHPITTECWHIEAKGETAAPGLDFRTCLGQLIQRMRDRKTRYGVALPDTPSYASQIAAMSPWVIDALEIHWILVARDGSVRIVSPGSATTSDL